MIRRHKTTIFTDAKESSTVFELKRIVEGILKRPPDEQRLYKVRRAVVAVACVGARQDARQGVSDRAVWPAASGPSRACRPALPGGLAQRLGKPRPRWSSAAEGRGRARL